MGPQNTVVDPMINQATIRAGLDAGEFFVEYLPTVSLKDGHCIGTEALVRWRRPTGVVPPMEFIPLIENTMLSGLLTYRVMDIVAEEMSGWLKANPDAHLSMNVPPEILGRGGVEYAARKSGLYDYIKQIVMEITERGVPDFIGVQAINTGWDLGLRVALDDVTFSSGANLAVLARSKWNILKLDRSLIDQICPENPQPGWLTDFASVLKSSDLMVIAEGVETPQQLETLKAAQIPAAQGFLFSPPVSARDFMAFHEASQESRF